MITRLSVKDRWEIIEGSEINTRGIVLGKKDNFEALMCQDQIYALFHVNQMIEAKECIIDKENGKVIMTIEMPMQSYLIETKKDGG